MALALTDIWPIENPTLYKIHFARWNGSDQPLEVFVRSRQQWQAWQEYYPGRNDFNRPHIFSLVRFYHEPDIWMFGGIFDVLQRHPNRYEVKLSEVGREMIGRLKVRSSYRERTTRANFENHYPTLEVQEILREPYSGRRFPGYDDIDLSFEELEALVKNARPDWMAALKNAKGIYRKRSINHRVFRQRGPWQPVGYLHSMGVVPRFRQLF
ncbi:GIY-YIG nuclease family protein [Alcaligenaceae bacterium]|nr:GIY-YIG nuclease family protein [Alcaligenaceae bacterium]